MSVPAPLPENNGLFNPVLPWPLHPACAAWPEMEPAPLRDLADDIAKNGVHELITLTPVGELLDGRNRTLACIMAGVDPTAFTTIHDGDPWLFSLSKNKHRRHINKDQIALAIARMVATKPVGANQHGSNELPSNAQLAAEAGLTETALKSAKTVVKHGTPEENKAVESGKKGVLRKAADRVRRERRRALAPPAPPKATPKPAEPATPVVDPIDAVALAIISQCSDGKWRTASKIATAVKFAPTAVREALNSLGEDCVAQRKAGSEIEYRIERGGEALLRRTVAAKDVEIADRDRVIADLEKRIAEKDAEIERLTDLLTAPPRPTASPKKASVSKH
jgi:hypothetical protein